MTNLMKILVAAAAAGMVVTAGAVVHDRNAGGAAISTMDAKSADFGGDGQIAGSGLVEAGSGTIAVASPVAGVVASVAVQWGEQVHRGDLLFRIDDRDIADTRPVAAAELEKARLAIPAASQAFMAAQRLLADQLTTMQDVSTRKADLAAAHAAVTVAEAQLRRIDAEIARRTVRAPTSGRILKINLRPGEYADPASSAGPPLLMGSDQRLNVRAEFDEYDVWRLRDGTAAIGTVPGNPAIRIPLRFERIEPYVLPKTNLSGAATERTDTRVLQVIYSFDPKSLPVYIGQRLDVEVATTGRSARVAARP
ncbi:MAG TPA: efflux RND transporter periplasmic adaptor subunit [Acetobacteraceae bacterium]|nr:efflux RND transporter periplasmic adaptor subunit [Acetobacteraceae bacterium]